MPFHRIKKYSRQIVCQDCVLSCRPNNVEEIPLLKRALISSLSLRNQRTNPGSNNSTLLERDLDLSGMLMCWHLLNSRSLPFLAKKKRAENRRQPVTGRHERLCYSLLTLRDQRLYTAIEKYLLFLMPREMRREGTVYDSIKKPLSRRDRSRLSALYVHTALGLCQYKIQNRSCQPSSFNAKTQNKGLLGETPKPTVSTFSPEKMVFSDVGQGTQNVQSSFTCSSLQSRDRTQNLFERCSQEGHKYEHTRVRARLRKTLSLYCSTVLNSPDIQDIAQSGLITLEGSLTLELL